MYNDQKMSREQLVEVQHVLDIIRSAISVRRKTIKGVQYHIARCTDASGKEMQLVFGGGSWTTAPADKPLKECLPVRQYEN